jgi:hypothetical protein
MTRAWSIVLALVLGCNVTGTVGRDDPNGGGSGGGTAGSASETEAAATSSESIGTAEGGGTGTSGEDESTGGDAGSSSESTAAIPHACIPTPDDSECSACRKTTCCEPLEACLAHEPCTCWWECIQVDGHDADGCAMACGADALLFEDLQTCSHGHCPACP